MKWYEALNLARTGKNVRAKGWGSLVFLAQHSRNEFVLVNVPHYLSSPYFLCEKDMVDDWEIYPEDQKPSERIGVGLNLLTTGWAKAVCLVLDEQADEIKSIKQENKDMRFLVRHMANADAWAEALKKLSIANHDPKS